MKINTKRTSWAAVGMALGILAVIYLRDWLKDRR